MVTRGSFPASTPRALSVRSSESAVASEAGPAPTQRMSVWMVLAAAAGATGAEAAASVIVGVAARVVAAAAELVVILVSVDIRK